MEEENDEPRPPLVLYNDVGECRVIGAIGYGEGGRVVYKAEYKVDDKFRRFVSMIYVKESDSEAYQNLRSQTSDSYQCTWDHGDPYPRLNPPLMLLDWLPIRSKGYYCVKFAYMEHGSLISFMARRFPRGLPELFILYILFTTLRGLWDIQNKNKRSPVHRQISAAHIFIHNIMGREFMVMLGYGATVFDDLTSSPPSVCKWATAPEVYGSDTTTYGAEADIWLVGITALELAYGGIIKFGNRDDLEHAITNMHRMRKLPNKLNAEGHLCWDTAKAKGRCPSVFPLLPSCLGHSKNRTAPTEYEYMPQEWVFSNKFVDLVLDCLDLDPTKRPTTNKLIQLNTFDAVKKMHYFEL